MKLEYAALTDVGSVRENNEDCYGHFVPDDENDDAIGALFVVADGMGGHRGGGTASRIAVDSVIQAYRAASDGDPVNLLESAFLEANQMIIEKSVEDTSLFGMGTTCTAVAIKRGNAYFGHVGDSRAYLVRDGEIVQVTEDHSLVGEMVRSGLITDEDARTHPKRNIITRSLGCQGEVKADTPQSPMQVEPDDTFVICSDGLTGYVLDGEIRDSVTNESSVDACQSMVDMATERGGRDNITVQVIRVIVP